MRVAVCDDNLIFLEEMKRELLYNQGIEEVDTYSEIEAFFEEIKEEERYDAVFLDIDWGDVKTTGLEFGERLYELIPHVPIILMTGYNDRFAQHILLSEMNLIGYLTKPIDSPTLSRYLEKIRTCSRKTRYINISCQGMVIRLATDDIRHIESHNHKIHIYTENEVYEVYEKISDISKRLPEQFVQCHKSYLVNLDFISALDGKEVVMKDGSRIAISRTFHNHMKEKFFEFIGRMI